jgi:hypothetical protein
MTGEQRQVLEDYLSARVVGAGVESRQGAIRAALAEIDELRGAEQRTCEVINGLLADHRWSKAKIDRLETELAEAREACVRYAHATGDLVDQLQAELAAARAESLRPMAIAWSDANVVHAFESSEDANRYILAHRDEPGMGAWRLWHLDSEDWILHPRGGGDG